MHDQNIAANRTFGQQFEQVKQYFDDRSTDLRLLANKRRPATQSSSCCLSMADVCRCVGRIVHRPRAGTLGDHRYRQPYVGEVLWHRRIVLIGRRGAGRKTQAALLANQLQLVFGGFRIRIQSESTFNCIIYKGSAFFIGMRHLFISFF